VDDRLRGRRYIWLNFFGTPPKTSAEEEAKAPWWLPDEDDLAEIGAMRPGRRR
jgi:hypothetical protein